MTKTHLVFFWKMVLVLTIAITLASMIQMVGLAHAYNINIFHSYWIILLSIISIAVIVVVILAILLTTKRKEVLLEIPEAVTRLPRNWQILAGCVFILLLPIYSIVTLNPYLGRYYAAGAWTHLALSWWLSLISMFCLKTIKKDLSWFNALWLEVLISAVFYIIVKQFLPVTNYPFALTWSEAGRFYGASLFFSKQIYGVKIPLGIMHPTWHFLLAIPFLLGKLPIWVHRLWWALLQLVFGITASWILARRLRWGNRYQVWIVAGWVMIFLFPRPILVHLLLCTLLILWGYKPEKFWRTTSMVILASIWAGLSRINWFPVPGIFAAALYFLEIPFQKPWNVSKYLWKPLLWILGGTLIAIASNLSYMPLSGNGAGVNFSSSLTSTLLWYRLLPSSTYPQGVLLDLLLLTGPFIITLIFGNRYWREDLHPVRRMGIATMLGILLAGGLVVSVKIGGGSDLHNLDAFLILLTIVGGYLILGCYAPESEGRKPVFWRNPVVLALLLITPVWMIIRTNMSVFVWDKERADRNLNLIRQNVEDISQQGGEVLFISQRQLLALKMVKTALMPDYEQDFLMEMVMSHNQPYLEQFQEDIREQKFAAIVANTQNTNIYRRTRAFGEENDLWVQSVSVPLLCYYESPQAFADLPIIVYIPRSQPCK
jgi:hypothetical protein